MVSFILSIIAIFAIYFSTGSVSSTVMGSTIVLAGILFGLTIKKKERFRAYTIFNIVFLVTTILILIRYNYLLINPDPTNAFKSGIDQSEIYDRAELAYGYSSYSVLLIDTFRDYLENQGYYLYVRTLSYLGYNLFDGNHEVLQMLGSSLFGCLLSILLYKLFLLFFTPRKAVIYTLVLFFLSPILQHSIYLLRDIHATFVYTIAAYILLKEYKIKNYIWLAICVVLAWVIRPQSGMFALVFPALYYYIGNKKNVSMLVFVGTALAVVFFVFFYNTITTELTETFEFYENRTEEMASENMSYDLIYKLPPPFKQIGQIVVYTFLPLNVWLQLSAGFEHLYPFLDALMRVIARVFWFYVMWLLIKWVMSRKGWAYLNQTFKWLFAIVVLFYFMNATDMNVRRTMCVSPILFTIFLLLKNNCVTRAKYIRDLGIPTAFFLATSLLYTMLKLG